MTGDSELLAGAGPAGRDPGPGGSQAGRYGLAGIAFDRLTEAQVNEHIIEALGRNRGGSVVPANIDVCRLAAHDPALREVISGASLVLADGMPLLWAARLRGDPLPERVAGASLIFSLTGAAAGHGRSVYLLGGAPGIPDRAARELRSRYPGLTIAGTDSPPLGFDATDNGIKAVRARLAAAAPDIVYVGLGCPKQERLIARLAPSFPATWFIACGAAIPFTAKALRRAPRWMRQAGLSWLFRLATEPRRLFKRYVIHDLPFAGVLLASSAALRALRLGRR
jgi:N-acetylglucosaminyldiphosphoundecaprenol N-acetyl-beta-D-mannosaminyltransferase